MGIFLLIGKTGVWACDNLPMPSPWFKVRYEIDEETLPENWISGQNGDYASIKYVGKGIGYLLRPLESYDKQLEEAPDGYYLNYRFDGEGAKRFDGYKKEWKVYESEDGFVTIYSWQDGENEERNEGSLPGYGFGMPENLSVPDDKQLELKVMDEAGLVSVRLRAKYRVGSILDKSN